MRGETRVLLCVSCVNWQRRASYKKRKEPVKGRRGIGSFMLLPDQLALFMLQPGSVPFPDKRCAMRLLVALKEPGDDWVPNLIFSLMPLPVQTMIGMMESPPCRQEKDVMVVVLRTWWEYNGRTVFFSNRLTAKLVRKVVRDDNKDV